MTRIVRQWKCGFVVYRTRRLCAANKNKNAVPRFYNS
jgi:hypothetical protein